MGESLDRSVAMGLSDGTLLETALAVVAHELRGPLLAVEETVEWVAARSRMSDEDRRLLELATIDLHRLSANVHGLLTWSSGTTGVRRRRTDLAGLVNDIASSLTLEHRSDRVLVRVLDRSEARVDPTLARIAIENVVRNGLTHSGSRDPVEVTVDRVDRSAVVVVRDRGRGIPDGEKDVVFQAFARGPSVGTEGYGLGLFIADRVVQAHGGSIEFEPVTRGTAVRIEFPEEA
jgi:two-component system OmpR family sensor kinase